MLRPNQDFNDVSLSPGLPRPDGSGLKSLMMAVSREEDYRI